MKKIKEIIISLPNGLTELGRYNKKGLLVYGIDSFGMEYWKEYDEDGKEIHYKSSTGYEY